MSGAERGTEAEDLRVIIHAIQGALCQYCNEADDPYTPVSDWNESCQMAFEDLCKAYNAWHVNHKAVGEISMQFWTEIEADLCKTADVLRAAERANAALVAERDALKKAVEKYFEVFDRTGGQFAVAAEEFSDARAGMRAALSPSHQREEG